MTKIKQTTSIILVVSLMVGTWGISLIAGTDNNKNIPTTTTSTAKEVRVFEDQSSKTPSLPSIPKGKFNNPNSCSVKGHNCT